MPGPTTSAVLVNLLLDGELEQMLREPVSDQELARIVSERIAEIADKLGAPTQRFSRWTISRWADVYGIER